MLSPRMSQRHLGLQEGGLLSPSVYQISPNGFFDKGLINGILIGIFIVPLRLAYDSCSLMKPQFQPLKTHTQALVSLALSYLENAHKEGEGVYRVGEGGLKGGMKGDWGVGN